MSRVPNKTPYQSNEDAGMRKSSVRYQLAAALALAVFGALSLPAQAWEFSSGEWTGSIDTTISYGASWRLKDYDPSLVGKQANNPLTFTLDKAAQRERDWPLVGQWR